MVRGMTLLLLLAACGAAPDACTPPWLPRVVTWTIASRALGEQRRVFVYLPEAVEREPDAQLPVLYVPDGGVREDLAHVVDAAWAGELWGTLQPMIVVGIENTDRKRDLTDGSAAFRAFLRDELMPEIARRHPTSGVDALIGESLAGRFVVETFLEAPELFDHCIAFDPSLWWNDGALVARAAELLERRQRGGAAIYLTTSNEPSITAPTRQLAEVFASVDPGTRWWHYLPMPAEHHDTIYRASAPRALRRVFAARRDE